MVEITPVLPEDIPDIVAADQAWLKYYDEDFEVETVAPWCLTEDALMEFVRKRRSEENCSFETWTYALKVLREVDGEAEVWTCGGFGYELQDDLYGLHFCVVHPDVETAPCIEAVADFLTKRADGGGRRREVRLWLRDRDEKSLRICLPAWKRAGFKFKLVPDHFAEGDGWLGVHKKRKRGIDRTASSV